jgi:hypothetical protein
MMRAKVEAMAAEARGRLSESAGHEGMAARRAQLIDALTSVMTDPW